MKQSILAAINFLLSDLTEGNSATSPFQT